MEENYQSVTDQPEKRPILWNPLAAAMWSLLFSPVFGAFLHASNWRALGQPKRATANLLWAWGLIIFFAIYFLLSWDADFNIFGLAAAIGIDGEKMGRLSRVLSFPIILAWLLSLGRKQIEFIKKSYGKNYIKRGWLKPLALATVLFIAYLMAGLLFHGMLSQPSPETAARIIEPNLLQAWRQKPELRDITIQKITLHSESGGNYDGFVDVILKGKAFRFPLKVQYKSFHFRYDVNSSEKLLPAPPPSAL